MCVCVWFHCNFMPEVKAALDVNLICHAQGWDTVSAVQMAKLAHPGAPHPSLLRCDLFFLAGDPATLCPKTEVLDQYGSSPSLHLAT